MKKTLSLLAMLTILIGAVAMITSCGTKPKAGTVWEATAMDPAGKNIFSEVKYLVCFHTDGHLYIKATYKGKTDTVKDGTYAIDNKSKRITFKKSSMFGDCTVTYTLKKETMTFIISEENEKFTYTLKKTRDKEFKS